MDDFAFPTTAAASATAAADTAAAAAAEPLRLHLHHHRRRRLHFVASPLWFPSSCPVAVAPPDVPVTAAAVASAVKDVVVRDAMAGKEQEDDEAGGGGGGDGEATSDAGRREEGEEEKKAEEATTTTATRELSRGGDDDDGDGGGGGAARDEEEKMDLLWENFNEELQQALHQRVGSCPRADARAAAAAAGMELSPETSDAESEPAAALRGHVGCAPMLRPSSRAGAGGYRRTTSWVLLMKIFRRLFVIEKTISSSSASASGRHASARR